MAATTLKLTHRNSCHIKIGIYWDGLIEWVATNQELWLLSVKPLCEEYIILCESGNISKRTPAKR